MKTTELAKANWSTILSHYGLPQQTGNRHVQCPLCGKKKFRISKYKDDLSFICTCERGDIWKLLGLTTGKNFKTLATEIDSLLGNNFKREKKEEPVNDPDAPKKWVNAVVSGFGSYEPIKGTLAAKYLNAREIYDYPQNSVKFKSNGDAGSIVAIATDSSMNACYLHITELDSSGKKSRKQHKAQHSKYLEYAQSVAIRLEPAQSTLGLAEGLETALSAKAIYKCATWSTMTAGFMSKFIAPRGVEHLMIFADSDSNGTGHAAAFSCANKNLLNKNDVKRVTVIWPSSGDFNDVLIDGRDCFKWQLGEY